QEFPGRWAGGTLWVEPTADQVNDGVSSIIVGSNDWAGAWAIDGSGRPLHAAVPGGEPQREFAYRFGVNLVMYALTGNSRAIRCMCRRSWSGSANERPRHHRRL